MVAVFCSSRGSACVLDAAFLSCCLTPEIQDEALIIIIHKKLPPGILALVQARHYCCRTCTNYYIAMVPIEYIRRLFTSLYSFKYGNLYSSYYHTMVKYA